MFSKTSKTSKTIVSLLVLAMLALAVPMLAAPTLADQVGGVTVTVNGQAVSFPDQQPYIDSGSNRVFVPLRFVSEAMGCQVYWCWHAENDVTVTRAANDIEMPIGSTQPTVNGVAKTIDAPAVIANGRTMVPLRFISKALGATVNWDASSKTVSITDGYLTASTYTVNGYVVPKDTDLQITDQNDPIFGGPGLDIQMVVHMNTHQGTPENLQAEWADVQNILSQRFDAATVQTVMSYVEQKTSGDVDLPTKRWIVDGKRIEVDGGYNSDCYIDVVDD